MSFMRCVGERGSFTRYLVLAVVAATVGLPTGKGAIAQQSGRQFRSEPSNYERYSSPPPETQLRSKPSVPIHAAVEQPTQAPAIAPFRLTQVAVEGVTAISPDNIASTYSEKIGSIVSGQDILEISQQLTTLYRNAGYHLSRAIIPPQDLRGGVLRIVVIEGSIEDVALAGKGDPLGVTPILRPILAERPSKLSTLERQLLLVNDRPGARVTDVSLAEIGTATGRFRLVVTVETWRIFWTQGLDNSGSSSVGPLQGYSSAALNSFLMSGDSLAVAGSTAPDRPSELWFGKASYDAPIGTDGARIGFSAYQNTVRPGDARRFYNDATRTTGYDLRGSIVPVLSRTSSLTFSATASYIDSFEGDVGGLYYADKIRAGSVSADYKLKDDFDGWNNFIVTLRQGFGFRGASTLNDPTSRYGASGEFTAVNLAYTRLHTFSEVWSTKLSVTSQFAGSPLLLSQQYFLGGAAFGPGYYSGDNGVGGSFELRFDQRTGQQYLNGYQLYGFLDGGQTWDVHDGVRASLASAGAGARFFISDSLTSSVSVAFPVNDRFGSTDPSNFRILFSVLSNFKICSNTGQWDCGAK